MRLCLVFVRFHKAKKFTRQLTFLFHIQVLKLHIKTITFIVKKSLEALNSRVDKIRLNHEFANHVINIINHSVVWHSVTVK